MVRPKVKSYMVASVDQSPVLHYVHRPRWPWSRLGVRVRTVCGLRATPWPFAQRTVACTECRVRLSRGGRGVPSAAGLLGALMAAAVAGAVLGQEVIGPLWVGAALTLALP